VIAVFLTVGVLTATAGNAYPTPALPAVAVHHSASVRLDPHARSLLVEDIIRLTGRKAATLRIADWLSIDNLLLDGESATARRLGNIWHVALPDRDQHELKITLHGKVPGPLPAAAQGLSLNALASPEGSYLPDNAAWLPDSGDDWIHYNLDVVVPRSQRVVASGQLVEESTTATSYRATFVADYPSEPPALFAGPFTIDEKRSGPIRIRTYFHSDVAHLADLYLNAAAAYLQSYSDNIGPYPYRDFHIVSAALPVGLGFPNLTYVSRDILGLPFMQGRSLAHEVLHNWWGNGVRVDYASGNWSEGLTTYLADHALAEKQSAEAARQMRLGWLRDYAALPAGRDEPVTAFTAKQHRAGQVLGYNKVAFLFHMLKQEVGAALFQQAIRDFWQTQRFSVAGWRDLQAVFERTSGRPLSWFFSQWLDRPGAPRIKLAAVAPSVAEGGTAGVAITIIQDPPYYRVNVPVDLDTAAGTTRHRVQISGAEKTTILSSSAPVLSVRVDPDHDVFRRLLPGESPPILRDVSLQIGTKTVIAASDEHFSRIALVLAERLLDGPVETLSPDRLDSAVDPLLVIGTDSEVARLLESVAVAQNANDLSATGTARAWATRHSNGAPMLVVTAQNAAALGAVLRPLPHYGGSSYVVFDGGRAVDKGLWTVLDSPLKRQLTEH
jgi:aminopeptidase N